MFNLIVLLHLLNSYAFEDLKQFNFEVFNTKIFATMIKFKYHDINKFMHYYVQEEEQFSCYKDFKKILNIELTLNDNHKKDFKLLYYLLL